MRWLHALFALAMNAVPIVGVLVYGWSVPTILVLFWLENVLITAVHCARIVLHRRLTRRAGHWNHTRRVNGRVQRTTLLANFAMMAGFFTLGHGAFVALLAFQVIPDMSGHDPTARFDAAQFAIGAQLLLLFTSLDLLLDIPGMRERRYAWIAVGTASRMARVIVLQLGILFGALAIAWTSAPLAILCVLLGLKALVDFIGAWVGAAAESVQTPDDDRLGARERVA